MAAEWIRGVGRAVVFVVVVVVALLLGIALFVEYPTDTAELLGVVFALGVVALGARAGGRLAGSLFPDYNVAEVAVEGPITRDGGGRFPSSPTTPSADEVVDQMERADEDDAVDALVVKLNTPGGQVVPSDDIRLAAERFDGPTVAYATDTCASGGYWIASGCDELWAREGSIVGSIGVIGSFVNAKELADRVGLSYERLAAGEYKDAGTALKEFEEDEREYLQGIIDGYYETFVERVAEGRDMDPDAVRETEARVYLGAEAADLGLVDELGTREDVEDHLSEVMEAEARIREFEPQRGLASRVRGGTAAVAFAFGAGLASVVGEDGFDFRV
jgi:protease-4